VEREKSRKRKQFERQWRKRRPKSWKRERNLPRDRPLGADLGKKKGQVEREKSQKRKQLER
jgi:hypothetical protein